MNLMRLTALTEAGHQIDCPCCSRGLREVLLHQWRAVGDPPAVGDQVLSEAIVDREGQGWNARLFASHCPQCGARLLDVDLMPVEADAPGAPFIGSSNGMSWLVTRFELPAGRRYGYRYGPFPDDLLQWVAPAQPMARGYHVSWATAKKWTMARWLMPRAGARRFRPARAAADRASHLAARAAE